jgi:hypothetical protein
MKFSFQSIKCGIACAILISGVFVPLSFATPHLKITSPPQRIAADQKTALILRIEWPAAEDPYEINSLEPKVENLTLVDQSQAQETGPMISHTITYTFRPLKKGSALIYPFEISFRKSETDPWSPLLVPEQKIRVISNLPFKPIVIGVIFLSVAFAAGFWIFGIVQRMREQKAAREMPAPDPKQRSYSNAEEAIATFTSPDAKAKLTHWSNQLRTVVATYYDASAKSSTSAELLSFLKAKGLPAGEWNEVSRLFEQLTEMQFSRQDIPSSDLDRMKKTLLQYIKGKIIIENPDS